MTKNLQVQYPQIISSSHSSIVNYKNLQGQYSHLTFSSHSYRTKNFKDSTKKLSLPVIVPWSITEICRDSIHK